MAKLLIDLGSNPNDGTGSNLRAGGTIINADINEIYSAIGDGTDLKISVSGASTDDVLKYNGSSFVPGSFALELSADATPQLGGSLDLNGNSIVTTSNANVNITPDGTGNTVIKNAQFTGPNSPILTFNIADDSSTIDTISTGATLQFSGGNGITTTVTNDEVAIASTGKISFQDQTSTIGQVGLGETLRIVGSGGLTSSISGNDITLTMGSITNANVDASANIAVSKLASSAVTLGSTAVTLGTTAASAAGFSLTGASSLSGTGTIDVTSAGNKIRHQFANIGSLPNATTYEGMFATDAATFKAYFAESGSWIQILSENESVGKHNDVDTTTTAPANGSVLAWNSSDSEWEPHNALTSTTNQAVAQYDVTSTGNDYFFGDWISGANPDLTLVAGQTYCFNLDVEGGHDIRIQTEGNNIAGTLYNTGVSHVSTTGVVTTGSGAQDKLTGQLYFEVPYDIGGTTLYYQCLYHTAMYGELKIVSPNDGNPSFRAFLNTATTIGHNSSTLITFEQETFDSNSTYNTSDGKFTPLLPGKYFINTAIRYQTQTLNQLGVRIFKNGSSVADVWGPGANTSGAPSGVCSTVVDMNGTTDFIQVYTYHFKGSDADLSVGSSSCYFEGFKL